MNQDKFKKVKESLALSKGSEGLFKCGVGSGKTNIIYDSKHPVPLTNDHRVTELIFSREHERVFYNGLAEKLTQIRSQM